MEIDVVELHEKLTSLGYGVSKSESQLAYADCIMFNGGEASCFNGSAVSVAKLDIGVSGVVNYTDFLNYIRTFRQMDESVPVKVEVQDGSLILKRGRAVSRLPFSSDLPLQLDRVGLPDPDGWKPLPNDFQRAIKRCESIYVRTLVSDNILSCIHITGETIEAATPEQVIRVACELDVPHDFLIKFGAIGKLYSGKFSQPHEYQVSGRWFFLRSGDIVYGAPISTDTFVAIDRFFVSGDKEITFPDPVSMDLPIFQSLYIQSGVDATVEFQKDRCTISMKTRRGQHKTTFPLDCPENETYIMPPSLLKTLAKYGKCTFTDSCVHINADGLNYAASVTKDGANAFN